MTLEIIRIRPKDNLDTILHHVRLATGDNVLVVLPPPGESLLAEQVDLARVKSAAKIAGTTLGIVAIDRRVHAAGSAIGVPVYSTLWLGRRLIGRKRPWWLPKKPARPGKATVVTEADRNAMHRRIVTLPRWMRFGWRYIVIVLFVMTLAILAVTGFYGLPSATITLKPELVPLNVTQQIVADPQFDETAASGSTVPGRLLLTVQKIRTNVQTTGIKSIPIAPARGTVTFVNRIQQPVTIPAGTRVSTSTGERIIYQTVSDAAVPARVGGEVDVEVVALESGERGNLPADRINRIEGVLSAQLNVRNLWAIGGGSVQVVNSVTQQDKDRLRDHLIEALLSRSTIEMEEELTPEEFLAYDSVRLIFIYDENYSHFVGEATDELSAEIRAEIHGTAVNEQLAFDLLLTKLNDRVPDNYSIIEDSVKRELGRLLGVDAQGRVNIELITTAMLAADLSLTQPIERIAGQEIGRAKAFLDDELSLREPPEVKVWPQSFDRIPYLPARIYTRVDTES